MLMYGKTALLERQLEAQRPDKKLMSHQLIYERLEGRLQQAMRDKYQSRQQQFTRYVDRLSALSPTSRLRGGYVFAQTKEGNPLTSAGQIEKENPFFITFSDGQAEVDIIEQLSSEEISLSDSMDLYKKGVKILDKCSQTLDKTQKEIIILQEGQNDAIHKGTAFEED